jgi:hypothetical protein
MVLTARLNGIFKKWAITLGNEAAPISARKKKTPVKIPGVFFSF